jgi:HPt (histidine-containing phosphotransfer) domain-containing protein
MSSEIAYSETYPLIANRLENQLHSLQQILSDINNKRTKLRENADKWNIHEIVAHLLAYQQMYTDRVIQTLEEEVPFFVKYDAATDSDYEYYKTSDLEHLVSQLISERQKLTKLIGSLTDEQLNRIAMHKKYGSHNVLQWTEFFLLHEAHHIYRIFQLAYDIELK